MPYYAFSLDVPASPDVVAARIRHVVGTAPGFWEGLTSTWRGPNSSSMPFVGTVEGLSFSIRRNIQYRNSFLPQIRGRISAAAGGSKLNAYMYMHPLSLIFMLVWFGILASIELRIADTNVARSFLPFGAAIFGLALSLGGFYFEALKVMPALSKAVFDSSIEAPAVPPAELPPLLEPIHPIKESTIGQIALAFILVLVLGVFTARYFHQVRLRNSPAYAQAFEILSQSDTARNVLGDSIRPNGSTTGEIQFPATSGYTALAIPVRGEKGSGTLYFVANEFPDHPEISNATLWTGGASRQRLDITPPVQPDPFHYPATGRVYLLPLDQSAVADIQGLPEYYKARLGLDVRILPDENPPADAVDSTTRQMLAEKLVAFIAQSHPELMQELDAEVIGVTSQDLNIPTAGWRFALNYRHGRSAIVSTARLHRMPWYAGENPEAYEVRVRKLITKNLGILHYPVSLSSDDSSVLATGTFAGSDLDSMSERFGGRNGDPASVVEDAPCVSILKGPNGAESWRMGCISEPIADPRFEAFDNYTGLPLIVMMRADFNFKTEPSQPFVRKYRPQDDRSRACGIGSTDAYDILPVGDSRTFAWMDLVLAAGDRVRFNRTSMGTNYVNATLRSGANMGSPFSFSTIEWNGNGWDLTTPDHWIYRFPSSGPDRSLEQSTLTGLRSADGRSFSIQRTSANDLKEIRTPEGEVVDFESDGKHRLTSGRDSSGRLVQYEYDGPGRLIHIHDSATGDEFYEYDSANRLTVVRDSQHRILLENIYDRGGFIRSQTLSDGRKILYEFGYETPERVNYVKISFPNGYVRDWTASSKGFISSLPRIPNEKSTHP